MKRILFMLLSATIFTPFLAQDIILTKDAKRIDATIIEISDAEVRYKKNNEPDATIFIIPTSDISSIIFQNGNVKSFSQKEKVRTTDNTPSLNSNYVDLGLPSGTLWKSENEGNNKYYTYGAAVRNFGDNLPTKAQFYELKNNCTWTWTGEGVKIVGPNGNFIYLPALGWKYCMNHHLPAPGIGNVGSYWSSTPDMSDTAWSLDFSSNRLRTVSSWRCNQQAVRLVK